MASQRHRRSSKFQTSGTDTVRTVESPRSANLTAALTADVVVMVREGESVEKGQLLVKLDDRDSVLLLRQREAERAELRRNWIENQRDRNDKALQRELRVLELARRAVQRASELHKPKSAQDLSLIPRDRMKSNARWP